MPQGVVSCPEPGEVLTSRPWSAARTSRPRPCDLQRHVEGGVNRDYLVTMSLEVGRYCVRFLADAQNGVRYCSRFERAWIIEFPIGSLNSSSYLLLPINSRHL